MKQSPTAWHTRSRRARHIDISHIGRPAVRTRHADEQHDALPSDRGRSRRAAKAPAISTQQPRTERLHSAAQDTPAMHSILEESCTLQVTHTRRCDSAATVRRPRSRCRHLPHILFNTRVQTPSQCSGVCTREACVVSCTQCAAFNVRESKQVSASQRNHRSTHVEASGGPAVRSRRPHPCSLVRPRVHLQFVALWPRPSAFRARCANRNHVSSKRRTCEENRKQ